MDYTRNRQREITISNNQESRKFIMKWMFYSSLINAISIEQKFKKTLIYYGENHGTIPRTLELWLTKEKNHGTFTKTLICYYRTTPKQWKFLNNFSHKKFDLQWKKLWYHTKNYGTLIYYKRKHGTMEKTKILWKKYGTILWLTWYNIFVRGVRK